MKPTIRPNHYIEVAKKMYELAKEIGYSEEKSREMYVLGILHDVGDFFATEKKEHNTVGGNILKDMGYPHFEEVAMHGEPIEIQNEYLLLLNYADMTTMADGRTVTLEERLDDIGKRYGKDSSEYRNAQRVIDNIKHNPLVSNKGLNTIG